MLIQYDDLTCYLIITESILLVFTPLSKFFLEWSYIKGRKEKCLHTHIIGTEFFWLFHDKPRVSGVECLKGRVTTWG